MIRGVAAVIAGYVIMATIVMAGTFALVAAFVTGGAAAMRAMRDNPAAMPTPTPRGYVIALAVVVLAMGLVSGFAPGSRAQAAWYKLTVPLIGVLGVAIGGGIRGV